MIIDANMHWLPEDLFTNVALRDAFLACVPESEGEHAYVAKLPGSELEQIVIEKPEGHENLNYAENQYDPALRIADMDGAGVDLAVLRIPVWQSWLPLDLCKQVNDLLAAHVAAYPERVRALAVAPPDGTPACLAEVERALEKPGFVGVQMAAHYGADYLDAPRFRGYFKALNDLGVPVVVHHTPLPVDWASVVTYTNLRRQYGRCIDQGTAVGRELFSDLFEECPDLRLVHSMLGGGFFAFANMLAPRSQKSNEELERFDSASASASASRPTSTSTPPAPPSGARTSSSAPSRCSAPSTSSTAARIPSGASGSHAASTSCARSRSQTPRRT